jgi:tetratricopeptide (TPR) repeat protein
MMMKILILVVMLLIPASGFAHPESGFLPDAIAEMEYKIVLDINPKDIDTRNKLGIVLYRKNKLNEAEKEFSKVLAASPKDFDAHDGMGLVKNKQKKYEEAITWFKKAIAISDEDTMVHYHLGLTYELLGNFIDAEKAYKKALAVNDLLIRKGINKELEIEKKGTVVSALQYLQKKMGSAKAKEQ